VIRLYSLKCNCSKNDAIPKSNKKWLGLELLWKLIQDETDVPVAVSKKSFENMLALLALQDSVSQRYINLGQRACTNLIRQIYMDHCMNNINQGKSVPQSIELLQKILDEFPAKKRKRATTIEALDQKYKILKIFFQDVVRYKQEVSEKLQKEQAKNKNIDVNKIHVDKSKYTHLTHLDQVQLRLNFLSYLRANSSVVDQMNTEQVSNI